MDSNIIPMKQFTNKTHLYLLYYEQILFKLKMSDGDVSDSDNESGGSDVNIKLANEIKGNSKEISTKTQYERKWKHFEKRILDKYRPLCINGKPNAHAIANTDEGLIALLEFFGHICKKRRKAIP